MTCVFQNHYIENTIFCHDGGISEHFEDFFLSPLTKSYKVPSFFMTHGQWVMTLLSELYSLTYK